VDELSGSVEERRISSKGCSTRKLRRDDPAFLFAAANSPVLLLDIGSARYEGNPPGFIARLALP
jgi:hypothetical protein